MTWRHGSFGYPDTQKSGVYFSRQSPGGTWSAPINIDHQTGFFKELDFAVADNGNAVAVWELHPTFGSAPELHAARYENRAWQLPVAIGPGSAPQTAMSGDGPFATYQNDGTVYWIRYNGSGWTAPQALESHAETAMSPRIAGSDYAQPFFAWLQPSGVWARRLP